MKLELKKIKLGPGSEETTQFTAELYVDGKLAAHCDNAGKGGSTDIRAYEKHERELVEKAETFCNTLPPLKLGSGTSIPMNLEHWVDEQVWKVESDKQTSKIINAMKRATANKVVIVSKKALNDFLSGKGTQLGYNIIKYPHPFERYAPEARLTIVQRATAVLKDDEFIYNENLPKL